MKRFTAIFIILLLFTSLTYAGRTLPWIELTFSPAKVTEAAQKYRLLPTAEEQTDADAERPYIEKRFSHCRRITSRNNFQTGADCRPTSYPSSRLNLPSKS